MRIDRVIMYAILLFGVLLVALPALSLIYGALQTTTPGAPGQEWTLNNIKAAFSSEYMRAFLTTILLSSLVAGFSCLLAVMLSWITARTDTPGRTVLESLIIVPTFLSPLVGATGWLVLGAKQSGLINIYYQKLMNVSDPLINISSFGGTVWLMVLFFTPIAYLYIVASFRSVDATIEEAARLSGAKGLKVLFGVTIPIVTPAILTGAIMVWVASAEMFSIPGLLVGPGKLQPLAYKIFLDGRTYPPNHPMAAAAGMLLIMVTVMMLYLYRRITRLEGRFVTMGGKGGRPQITRLGRWRMATAFLAWSYIGLSVFLPYIALTIGSFQSFLGAPLTLKAMTLSNWKFVFGPEVMTGLKNSLLVGVSSGAAVIIMGTIAGYAISRKYLRFSTFFDYVLSAPIGIPGIVFGIGMIWAYVSTPLYGSIFILFIAFFTRYGPNGLRAVNSGLLQISKDIEESAVLAGASRGRVLKDIIVPLLKPTLFSAWALTTIIVIRELSISSVLYTPKTRVISVLAWDFLESGQYGYACAVGIIQTILVIAILLVARILFKVRLAGDTTP